MTALPEVEILLASGGRTAVRFGDATLFTLGCGDAETVADALVAFETGRELGRREAAAAFQTSFLATARELLSPDEETGEPDTDGACGDPAPGGVIDPNG